MRSALRKFTLCFPFGSGKETIISPWRKIFPSGARVILFRITVLFICLISSPAWSAAVNLFVTSELPPYVIVKDKTISGIFPEIIGEFAKELGEEIRVEVLPPKRAQNVLKRSGEETTIVFVSNIAEGHHKYTWLVPLPEIPSEFVLLATSPEIAGLGNEDLRKLSVGVTSGSMATSLLKRNGFENIEEVETEIQNAKRLRIGRISLWATPLISAFATAETLDYDKNKMILVQKLSQPTFYIATTKKMDLEALSKWRSARAKIKSSCVINDILSKYNYSNNSMCCNIIRSGK